MSYGTANMGENYLRAAEYVDRILNGASPATLPYQFADKFYLCLNRRTANTLGINFPQEMLTRADLVIE
jgi:putative ABC transport system substrate-binding protein